MKKKLNLLIVLLMILSVNTVKADEDRTEECKNILMSAKDNFSSSSGVTIKFWYNDTDDYDQDGSTGWEEQINDYTYYQLSGEERNYIAFCRNPGASAKISGNQFWCKKTLFNAAGSTESDADKANKAYEKGIIEILRNGSTEGASGTEYASTVLALRTFEKYWIAEANNGDYDDHRQNKIIKYYTDLWLDDSEIKSKLDSISGIIGSSYIRTSKYFLDPKDNAEIESWTASGGDVTSEVESGAKSLIVQAFDAAIDYLENGAATIAWKAKGSRSTSDSGVKYTHTIKIDKFTSSNASINAEVVCDDCASAGVTASLTVNGSSFSGDLLSYVSGGSGEVKLEVNFTKPSDTENCDPIDYQIVLTYYDDSISAEAYIMQEQGCTTCQEFFLLYADDVEKTQTIEGTAELCVEENNCTTYIQNAECSEEESDVNINEGYSVDSGNCGNISEDSLDVVNCVIDAMDPAGNSYQATTEEYVDNQFCSIWCKEDYHFVLPGIKEVNSGRYFSLQASVEGKKMCYTSAIDEENTFESQAETLRKQIIDLYNTWSKLDAIVDTSFSNVQTKTIYYTNEESEQVCSYDEEGNPEYCCPSLPQGSCTETLADKKGNYNKCTYTGNCSDEDFNLSFGILEAEDGNCDSGKCSDDNKSYQEHYDEQDYPSQEEAAASSLRAAIKAYADLINEYNSCFGTETHKADISTLTDSTTSGWKMDYIFEPKIKFWYQESYMNNVLTDVLETVGNVSVGGFTENFYNNDDGKVPTEETSNTFKDIAEVLSSGTNFTCYQSGDEFECSTREIQVGTVKYVKQQMESAGEYITPTQFYTIYPSGGIVVGEAGQEDNIENSDELTNLLPVGLGTAQGVYNYVLRVEDLGEYYDTQELGRIWGDDGSVLVTVLDGAGSGDSCTNSGSLASSAEIDGTTLDNGVYVCAYTVNCPDCPVECNPTCKNPVCPENNCPVECVNCVYTNNSPNVNYRPIAPGDINPNDKDIGVNWQWDESGINTGLEFKAYVTSTEIEEAGETIYDIDYEDTTQSIDTDFAMKIVLDSNMVNKIKSYNDQYEGNDGYANNSLKCYDHVNSNDGETYKNIYCYSTFLDELLYDSSTNDNIDIVGNRIIGSDENSSDTLRKTQTQSSGYWTTWSEATPSWNITTTNILEYQKNYKEIGIGPSWK